MSVVDIGVLHGRYVRLTDRFKAVWTYHQFASAVFKSFLNAPLPYTIDFQSTYDRIKGVSTMLNTAQARDAAAAIDLQQRTGGALQGQVAEVDGRRGVAAAIDLCDLALERASGPLLQVDDQI